jgi:hypothetical protein
MPSLRQTLKNLTPAPFWDLVRRLWFALYHASFWPPAALHPWRRRSIQQLARFKGLHHDQRCFIIGNGPSLKHTDVSKLKNEATFGMNRAYLAFPQWGFHTSYFISINDLVIQQTAGDIRALPMPKFLAWHARQFIQPAPDTVFLHTTYTGPKFARDARRRLWEGATVTYVALQLAFFMGFEEVILIGVDHEFATKGQPNTTVISQGDDPDHFDAGYFGESAGRRVLDATIDGKLTVFPKVDYNSLF